jgi:polyhydroxybutyrate depolymerase
MRHAVRTILTILLAAGPMIAGDPPARAGARDERKTLTHDGRERSYIVHLPPQYDGRTPMPVVINLHGGGGSGALAARMTGMSAKADAEGFIVVYPNGTGPLTRDVLLTWNAGKNCCGYAFRNHVDDVGFIRAMIGELKKDYAVDADRVWATGMSNGAMMSHRLGIELSDLIAGIAPVAGALDCEPKAPARAVSVLIIHGKADRHVRFEGGAPEVKADRLPRVDRSVRFAVEFWVKHNGCSTTPKVRTGGKVSRQEYTGGRDGTAVVLVAIEDEGHTWPGGVKFRRRADEPTREISATDAIWEFFKTHPRRSPQTKSKDGA